MTPAENLYKLILPYRMALQNECPADVQLALMVNRWINPWHALTELEKAIPFKRRQQIKETIK